MLTRGRWRRSSNLVESSTTILNKEASLLSSWCRWSVTCKDCDCVRDDVGGTDHVLPRAIVKQEVGDHPEFKAESQKHFRTMLSLYHTFPMPRFSNQPYGLQMRLVVMQQPVCASSNLQCQNNQLHSLLISQFTSSTFSSELYWMFHILHTSLLTSSLSSGLSLPKPLSGF